MFEHLQLMAAKKQPALRGEAATHANMTNDISFILFPLMRFWAIQVSAYL